MRELSFSPFGLTSIPKEMLVLVSHCISLSWNWSLPRVRKEGRTTPSKEQGQKWAASSHHSSSAFWGGQVTQILMQATVENSVFGASPHPGTVTFFSTCEICHKGNENSAQDLCSVQTCLQSATELSWAVTGWCKEVTLEGKKMGLVTEASIYREKESNQILLLSQGFYNQKMVLKQNNCQNHPVNHSQYYIIILKHSFASRSGHPAWCKSKAFTVVRTARDGMRKAILGDSLLKMA